MAKDTTASSLNRNLRTIEDITITLDKAIAAKEINPSDYANLKRNYESASTDIDEQIDQNDSRLFVIKEAEALLAWINGEKDTAFKKIKEAVSIKGDPSLLSEAGRGLASAAKISPTKTHSSTKEPLRGWLGFLYATNIVVAIPSILIVILGTWATFIAPQPDTNFIENLLYLSLFYAYAALSIFYLIFAPRHSRHSIPAAIALFSLLTLGCIANIFTPYTSDASQEIPYAYFITLSALIVCGIGATTYYAVSSRVREIFNR